MSTDDKRSYVEIVERDSREVVERMGPMWVSEASRVADGVRINLDRANFFVRIVQPEGDPE